MLSKVVQYAVMVSLLCDWRCWVAANHHHKVSGTAGSDDLRCMNQPNERDWTPLEQEVANSTFWMEPAEKVLLFHQLEMATYYFEYGCGGSTMFACKYFPSLQIRSIDSSKDWIDTVQNDSCVQQGMKSDRIHMHWIDIGAVGNLGVPVNQDKHHSWPDYSDSMKHVGPLVDFVLVDGRFRVASCLKAILYTNASKATLAIHDFFNRPFYHTVLKYADVTDCMQTMVILKAKPDVDKAAIEADISRFTHDVQRV